MPEASLYLEIASLALLFLLSAFFSGSETAYLAVSRAKVKKLAKEGDPRAETLLYLIEHPNRVLVTILVGNNLVNITAAALATSLAISAFGSKGVGIATGVVTLVVLIFGEITPKSFAATNAERVALFIARPIYFLMKLLSPIVLLLSKFAKLLVKSFGGEVRLGPFITEEELKMLVEVGEELGAIEKEEKEMITGIFEFGETDVREVMVPRIDMKCIPADASIEEARKLILETGHSRIPVYEGSIDNIIGILYAKDLLRYLNSKAKPRSLREILRPAYFVPETKKLDDLLREFQQNRVHVAIVVDEYGGTAGMVTLEDIIEEIVGEIKDEYDHAEEEPLERIDENQAVVDARMSIHDVNEALEISLPEDEFDTIGGLLFNTIGRIPSPGDEVEFEDAKLKVEKMRGRRIMKVRVVKK
ncbi:MAG: HlyC/CorC family transporter [Euryarchaeota archaeon]|nr:HlyC/CorC family transporter [Euryarchaeota archaeon]